MAYGAMAGRSHTQSTPPHTETVQRHSPQPQPEPTQQMRLPQAPPSSPVATPSQPTEVLSSIASANAKPLQPGGSIAPNHQGSAGDKQDFPTRTLPVQDRLQAIGQSQSADDVPIFHQMRGGSSSTPSYAQPQATSGREPGAVVPLVGASKPGASGPVASGLAGPATPGRDGSHMRPAAPPPPVDPADAARATLRDAARAMTDGAAKSPGLDTPAEPLRDTWSSQTDWWLDTSLYDPLRRLRSQAARIGLWMGIIVVPVVFYLFILSAGDGFSARMWSYINALSMSSGEYFGFVGILFTVLAILVGFQLASQMSSSANPGPEEDLPSAVLHKVRQRVRSSFDVSDEAVDKNERAESQIAKAFKYRDGHRQAEARSELVENLARAGVFAVSILSLPLLVSTLHEMRWGFALGVVLCVTLGFALLTVSITVSDAAPRESWQADRMLNAAALVSRAIDARRAERAARSEADAGGAAGGAAVGADGPRDGLPLVSALADTGLRGALAGGPRSVNGAANGGAAGNGAGAANVAAPGGSANGAASNTANGAASNGAAAATHGGGAPINGSSGVPGNGAGGGNGSGPGNGGVPASPGGQSGDGSDSGRFSLTKTARKTRRTAGAATTAATWERRIAAALAVALTLVACICIVLSSGEEQASSTDFLLDSAFFTVAFTSIALSLREAMRLLAARRVNAASNTQNSLSQRFRFCLALSCAGFVLALTLTVLSTVVAASRVVWSLVVALFLLVLAFTCFLVALGCLRADGQGRLRIGVRSMAEDLLSERLARAVVVIADEVDEADSDTEEPASPVSLVDDPRPSTDDSGQERAGSERRQTRAGRRSAGGAHGFDSASIAANSSALGA